jgi:hypothetical protein
MKKLSNLLYILLASNLVLAQNAFDNAAISLNMLGGYSFAPNKVDKTGASLDGLINGFEIGVTKQVNGTKEWHDTWGIPRIGLHLQSIFMNKPDTFGYHISLLPSVELRFFRWPNADISGKIAIGAAYASKGFDRQTNFDNRAVGSPINFALEVAGVYHHKITSKVDLNLELGYYHLSNGSFKMPNGGYNIYYTKLGVNYFFNQTPYTRRVKPHFELENKKIYHSGYISFAYREQGTFDYQRQYPVFTLHNALMKPLNKVYSLGIGLDLFYDATQALLYNEKLLYSQIKESNKYLAALGFCNELRIGKLGLPLEAYRYFYDLDIVKQATYIRFGLSYYPIKRFYMGCYFKGSINRNNTLESDFMEFAFGYSMRK